MKFIGIIVALCLLCFADSSGQERSSQGLQFLYTKSGKSIAADLENKNGFLRSRSVPKKLISSVKKSNELTVEVWVERPDLKQGGPARLVTISKNTSERNFTLGQEKTVWDFRLRTTKTSGNGLPSTATPKSKVKPGLSHVIFCKDKSGKTRIYLDGKVEAEKRVQGNFSNWDNNYKLAIGDEMTGGRRWKGTVHLVAIYSHCLNQREVIQNFKAGPGAATARKVPDKPKLTENEKLFSDHIAPIIANHCLECHDSATNTGDLDLSTKKTAFASVDAYDIQESIDTDEMPHKRPPLTAKEKQVIAQWVKGGAKWAAVEKIDPANYTYHGRDIKKTLKRLTIDEYIATVKSTVGVDIEKEAREGLPKDLRADGFSNTAYNLNVDFQHIEAWSRLASQIVGKVDISAFAKRFSSRRNVNDKDMRALIEAMSNWVLRGPVDRDEVNIYRGITTTVVAAGGGFDEAVSHVLEAMLQSPRFIYRIEDDDGSVSGDELATRLSYMIWGTSPDRELRQKASSGDLFDHEVCVSQIRRMMRDPRARKRSLTFASEWLNLGRLKNMKPNAKHFPAWDPALAEAMEQETLAFFDDIVWKQKKPVSNLLNGQFTYLTPALANHYGIDYQGKGKLAKHDISKHPERGGILTHGSVLTIGGDEASMVTRGLFVLNDILRSIVKDPPPCVNTTPVATKAGVTQRSIAEDRVANKACGGCHIKFEPLAFGLEKFDGVGAFHHKDHHGNQLRDDGKILFPGNAKAVAYQNSGQLMDLLAKSDRVYETIAWKLAQFSIGRPLRSDDLSAMNQIIAGSKKNGGTWHSLVEAVALSDLIQTN